MHPKRVETPSVAALRAIRDRKVWRTLPTVADVTIMPGLQSTVFSPWTEASSATVFVGGVDRTTEGRKRMSRIPNFFGYIAARASLHADNPTIGVRLNWPGQGASEGDAMETTINSRAALLTQFAEQLQTVYSVDSVHFVGSCMGAYCIMVAMDQMSSGVGRSMLLSPAAYLERSHDALFANDAFKRSIAWPWDRPVSESAAWGLVERMLQPCLMTHFEYEYPPLPPEICAAYAERAPKNPSIQYEIIAGVGHEFVLPNMPPGHSAANFEVLHAIGDKTTDFLTGSNFAEKA